MLCKTDYTPKGKRTFAKGAIKGEEVNLRCNFSKDGSILPIRKINQINMDHGYPIIEIGSLEIFGGAKYGNL